MDLANQLEALLHGLNPTTEILWAEHSHPCSCLTIVKWDIYAGNVCYNEAHSLMIQGIYMAHIFVSYSSKDRVIALELADRLISDGYEIWIDKRNITGQEQYWDEIQNGINRSSHLIFVISPDSIISDEGAMTELRHARSLPLIRRPTIIPIMVRAVPYEKLPIDVSPGKYQIYDFVQHNYEEMYRALCRALGSPILPAGSAEEVTSTSIKHQGLSTGISTQSEYQHDWLSLKSAGEYILSNTASLNQINVLKFTPDGKYLVAGLSQDRVALWKCSDGTLVKIDAPSTSVQITNTMHWPTRAIAISPDGKLLASSMYNQAIQLWNCPELIADRVIVTVNHAPTSLSFSPDGEWLIAGLDNDGYVCSWSISDNFRMTDQVKAHTGRVEAIKFDPNTQIFASCSTDGGVKSWRIIEEEIQEIRAYQSHDTKHVVDVAFSPDGRILAAGTVGGDIYLWESDTGKLINEFRHEAVVRALSFSPDGKLLVSGSNDRTLKIWSISESKKLISKKFEQAVRAIDISPNGRSLALSIEASTKALLWTIEA